MRIALTVDIEELKEIEGFLKFIRFHSQRLKCPEKDVFLRLAQEWENQINVRTSPSPAKPKAKKARSTYKGPGKIV